MQIKRDFAGSTDMWPTSAGGQLIKVANLTGFTVLKKTHKHALWAKLRVLMLKQVIIAPNISFK
jgi:hypothetical protein